MSQFWCQKWNENIQLHLYKQKQHHCDVIKVYRKGQELRLDLGLDIPWSCWVTNVLHLWSLGTGHLGSD